MEKYEFLSRTGEGAYGSVWRARDKNTGVMVAVKKMKDVPSTEEEGEIAMREVRVLQLAKHVNVVNLLEAYKSQSGRLYLVFEYVERTLLQELKANRSGLPPAVVKSVTWQLLQALSYLHRKQIIHRDVKPSNILITESGVLKICDFGFARPCSNAAADPAYTTYVVTRWYRPPEVLVGDSYGPPVDIWALGCIFAEMLVGRPLFPGKNHHDQLWLILKCLGRMTERQLDLLDADPQFACFRLPSQSEIDPLENRLGNVGPAAMQVLRACLQPDPKKRASADELLAMPFFQGVTELLPVSDLMAYPDPDMRAKLEKAVAQDQAAAAAAAAAAPITVPSRRESPVPPSGSKRPLARPSRELVQPPPPLLTASTSPQRPPPKQQHAQSQRIEQQPQPQQQQQQQQQPQEQQQPPQQQGSLPTACKAAGAAVSTANAKPEACSEIFRPPLQRHITAPPGSLAGRAHCQPLQPLSDHSHYLPQSHRSRSSADGSSQHGSPPKGQPTVSANGIGPPGIGPALGPARGRPWRGSGDGSGDFAIGAHPATLRQLSGPHLLQPHASAALGGGPGVSDPCRLGSEALLRPSTQRTTWNGMATLPRSGGSGDSSGGGSGSGGGGGGGGAAGGGIQGGGIALPHPSLSASQGNPIPPANQEAVSVQRRAQSSAGAEPTAPGSNATASGRSSTPAIGGLQGRSLAPHLGSGGISTATTQPLQLTPSLQLGGLPNVPHRFTPSPPPGYNGTGNGSTLRIGNSVPMSLPAGITSRTSHDGSGALHAPPHLAALGSSRHHPSLAAVGSAPHGSSAPVQPAAPIAGESDSPDSTGSTSEAPQPSNDGRRASDTVLYATLALKDARVRLDKVSAANAGTGRPPPCAPDGPPLLTPSGGSGGGASSHPLGALRVPSFQRNSGPASVGPPSPDCPMPPPNLPPLQHTPQRRPSAPEPSVMVVLGTGAGVPCGGGGGIGRGASCSMLPVNGVGYPQRHSLRPQQQSGNGDLAECTDGASNSHVVLPSLDLGAVGKASRVSASMVPGVGVARRPSKNSMRLAAAEVAHCKREEASKVLALEAVPEAGVL